MVVLECGDIHLEETSGTDGTVSFDGLNLSGAPVSFTYIHDDVARTWVGAGGPARTLPDPLSLTLGREDPATTVTMQGDLAHSAEDSLILVIVEGGYADITTEDRYEVDSLEGTGLALYALEWSTTGDVGTALVNGVKQALAETDAPFIFSGIESMPAFVTAADFRGRSLDEATQQAAWVYLLGELARRRN